MENKMNYAHLAGRRNFTMGYIPTSTVKDFEESANRPTGFVLTEEDKEKKLLILDGNNAIAGLVNKFKTVPVAQAQAPETTTVTDNIKYYTVRNSKGQETTQVVNGKVVNTILIPIALLEEKIEETKTEETTATKTITVSYFGAVNLTLIKDATRIKPCVASLRQAEKAGLDRGSGKRRIAALGDPTIAARNAAQIKDKVYDLDRFKVEYRKLVQDFDFNSLNDGDILTVYKDKAGLGGAQAAVLIKLLKEHGFNVLVIK